MTPTLSTHITIGAGIYHADAIVAIRRIAQREADRIAAAAEGDWQGAVAAPVRLRLERGRSMHHVAISCAWQASLGGGDAVAETSIEDALVTSGVLG